MNPEELAELGISVHLIKGYGDNAVARVRDCAECGKAHAVLPRWTARCARATGCAMTGMQLTGKTLGLIGFGGIAAEVARIALGSGMRVIAWNRSPRKHPKVEFVDLDECSRERRRFKSICAERRDARPYLGRLHRGHEARRHPRQYRARRHRR